MDALDVVNGAPGASISELQSVVDDLGVEAAVINQQEVTTSDVDLLYKYLNEGGSLIVYVKMRNGPSTPDDPSGHFIGLIKLPHQTLEIYDPAGEDVLQYLDGPLQTLASKFWRITTMDIPSQPEGTNSCGPWTIVRILEKAMPTQNFEERISKDVMSVNRNDTLQAFGPIGREKPHMSPLRAQSYSEFLQEYTNLNEAAAKHVAHVINRGVAQDAEVARSTVAELFRGLQKAIPSLDISDLFLDEYGGAAAGDFNEFVKTRKTKRGGKSPAAVALKGGKKGKRGGAVLGGAVLGGATLGGAVLGGAVLGGACSCMKPQTAKDRADESRAMKAYWEAKHGGMKKQTAKDRADESRAMKAYWEAKHGGMKAQTAKDRADESRAMKAYWEAKHGGMKPQSAKDRADEAEAMRRWWAEHPDAAEHWHPQSAEDREHESEGMRRWWGDHPDASKGWKKQTAKDRADESRAMKAYWAAKHGGMKAQTAKDRADERRGEERYVARKTSLLDLMK